MGEALQAFDIGRQHLPTRDHQDLVRQALSVERLQSCEEVFLHAGQEGIGGSVEKLDRGDAGPKGPVADQLRDRRGVVHHQHWTFHLEVVEQMTHTVAAV